MGLWKVLFAALAASTLAGCATVTRGLSDQVQINSDPPGAKVQTSMSHQCMTPCTLNVQRKDEFNVVISKPGFEPQTVFIGTRVAGSGAAGVRGPRPRGRQKGQPVAQQRQRRRPRRLRGSRRPWMPRGATWRPS